MGLSQAEFEKRRAARQKTASPEAREAQLDVDREAIDRLEEEHGYVLDTSLSVQHFVPGHAVMIGVRVPTEAEYKRYFQQVNRAGAGPDAKALAHQQLARTCLAYPSDAESVKALLAANPGLIAHVGNVANKLAELRVEDEGKD